MSASLGMAEVAEAGVAVGLTVVVAVLMAGLEAVEGIFGVAEGVCATAEEAIASRVVIDKVIDLMV